MPARVIRTSASVGVLSAGSSTRSTRTSWGPWKTVPFIFFTVHTACLSGKKGGSIRATSPLTPPFGPIVGRGTGLREQRQYRQTPRFWRDDGIDEGLFA